MKKLFIACLGTETNTFSNMPTGIETFAETMLYHGDATEKSDGLFAIPMKIWRKGGEDHQAEVVESLAAFAQPAGLTVRKVYEDFRDEILNDLKEAMPVDVVIFSLYGAMVADGYDDCEGDLLTRARAITGESHFNIARLAHRLRGGRQCLFEQFVGGFFGLAHRRDLARRVEFAKRDKHAN